MLKQRLLKTLTILILILGLGPVLAHAGGTPEGLTIEQQAKWERIWEEHLTHKLMVEISENYQPAATLALIDINVVPMTDDTILEGYTVIVQGGKIAAIGPKEQVEIPDGAGIVVASDHYLIPGLTEAHAHTQFSLSQFLVYLTRGVTTVREMDGFPWMLDAREMAAENDLLIPNLYVAGHILSNHAWDFYMTQIDTEDQAREAVRAQAAAGYDFIKIHNSMPEPLFGAIFDEAGKIGLDVVGHIPNEITIAHAVEAGMHTNEHFKGYINDNNLQITEQDYVAATTGSGIWNAPSFSNYHEHLRGKDAVALATEEDSLRLVPRWLKATWYKQASEPVDKLTELRQTIYPKSREIFTNLLTVTDKFIAGTDTGGYAFMVPGYALQEEVRIFEDLGLSPFEALKTATVNAAEAFRKVDAFGTIEVGKRADLVLLRENPLASTANLAEIESVMVRGVWLDDTDLEAIEAGLASIFSEDKSAPAANSGNLEELVADMEGLKAAGFPYPDYLLEEVEHLIDELGEANLAKRVDALQKQPGVAVQIPE